MNNTMQQQIVEHKKTTTSNQVVENSTKKDRRESKGRILAISRHVYKLLNSDVYYVESESSDNIYYFVKYNHDVFECCCCPDNYTRHVKCKDVFAIEFAIMKGTLKYIDRLPKEAKNYNGSSTTIVTAAESPKSKSYRD